MTAHRTCMERGPQNYYCTRRNRHSGDHIARGVFNWEGIYERWAATRPAEDAG